MKSGFGRLAKDFGKIVNVERAAKRTFPQWRGFELAPQGHLLEQVIDLAGDMGVAYERMVDFRKDFHAHDRLSLVCPRGACVVEVRFPGNGNHVVGSGVLLVIPAGRDHKLAARSSIFDAVALYPSAALLERVATEERIPAAALAHFRQTVRTLRRSAWFDQLLLEYFSRRVLARAHAVRGSAALHFFESELARETFGLTGLRQGRPDAESAPGPKRGVSDLALQYIEANLFGPLRLDAIARHAHASVSTLLRRFAEDTGTTPLKYVRNRRLDEAKALLENGTHNVAQVAILVGYENSGAFCEAFHVKFGKPPHRVGRRN